MDALINFKATNDKIFIVPYRRAKMNILLDFQARYLRCPNKFLPLGKSVDITHALKTSLTNSPTSKTSCLEYFSFRIYDDEKCKFIYRPLLGVKDTIKSENPFAYSVHTFCTHPLRVPPKNGVNRIL